MMEERQTMMHAEELWRTFLEYIKKKVSAHVCSTFFESMQATEIHDQMLVLQVADSFLQEWITANYKDLIEQELFAILAVPMEISIVVNNELREVADNSHNRVVDIDNSQEKSPTAMAQSQAMVANQYTNNVIQLKSHRSRLNKNYVFDTFVRGHSNDLALAASRAVAEHPAERYNPLFLFGGVGLGKTHLLHAIGHRIIEQNPQARVIFTSSEEFVNEVVTAMQFRDPREFYSKYRENCDVLLMDDIQLIAGKERTQHEFFHIFNILHNSNKQIVVTSDKLPHEIPDMEERLRNRFQWGLIADIQPPELETRVAILKRKADQEGYPLPNQVAFFIAEQIPSNVRKLEGALIRLLAHSSLTGRPLTIEYTREALQDVIGHVRKSHTVSDIQETVAEFYNLRVAELRSNRRHKSVARPRQVAMYLCRKHLKSSYPALAERFGGRDHTTVMSACKRVEDLLIKDQEFAGEVKRIERKITD